MTLRSGEAARRDPHMPGGIHHPRSYLLQPEEFDQYLREATAYVAFLVEAKYASLFADMSGAAHSVPPSDAPLLVRYRARFRCICWTTSGSRAIQSSRSHLRYRMEFLDSRMNFGPAVGWPRRSASSSAYRKSRSWRGVVPVYFAAVSASCSSGHPSLNGGRRSAVTDMAHSALQTLAQASRGSRRRASP